MPRAVRSRRTTRSLRLRDQYRFFHWHLEFPEVFAVPERRRRASTSGPGGQGGFDCVLGNPPWERVKLQEQEFFAQRDAAIAKAGNAAARKRLIAALQDDPDREFALRRVRGGKASRGRREPLPARSVDASR